MKKIRFVLPFLAIVLAIAASAFTQKNKNAANSVYWKFDSNALGDARNAGHYTMVEETQIPGCDDGAEIPCVLQVDASISSSTALQSYLNNTFQFPNDQAVVDQAFQTKSN
jgi:hypothetical protein